MKNNYGLIGKKLSHSYSPAIHSLILKEMGLEGSYDLIEIPEESQIGERLKELRANDYKGMNVTIPYKTSVMPFLSHISEPAQYIGAINTISVKEDGLYGANTDYNGFLMMLSHYGVTIKGKKAAVLGTGGASKAIIKALLDHDAADIVMISRNNNNIFGQKTASYEEFEKGKLAADIIINCTPVGMYPNIESSPISERPILKAECVVDLIYNPKETLLMKKASSLGVKNFNGLYMLVGQAVKAQEIWNDMIISDETTNKIYEQVKKERG